MADLMLETIDLADVHFTTSPAFEAALSLRALQHDPTGLHRSWVRMARERLAARPDLDLRPLLALVPRSGALADILTPTFHVPHRTREVELHAIRGLDPALLRRDVTMLRDRHGTRDLATEVVLDELSSDPEAGLHRIADTLEAYWDLTLAEHWPAMTRILSADIDRRSTALARHGLRTLMAELTPRVELLADRLRIESLCYGSRRLDGGRGLLLIPSVFADRRGLVSLLEPFVPRVIYHASGSGNVWGGVEFAEEHALDDALGRSRAQILRAIGVPSTTEVAALLGLGTATVNEHLAILRRAGLADSRRDGRLVLYARTSVGDDLVRAAD